MLRVGQPTSLQQGWAGAEPLAAAGLPSMAASLTSISLSFLLCVLGLCAPVWPCVCVVPWGPLCSLIWVWPLCVALGCLLESAGSSLS